MRLLVVGAGPKAIAIAAKAHVLRELGWTTPDVLILEKQEIAANWGGRHGFTHGKHLLGTPPEKDIGFPYESEFDPSVDRAMLAYSWHAHKIDLGEYSEWVDRGRENPRHARWAQYFQWAGARIHADVRLGELRKIEAQGAQW